MVGVETGVNSIFIWKCGAQTLGAVLHPSRAQACGLWVYKPTFALVDIVGFDSVEVRDGAKDRSDVRVGLLFIILLGSDGGRCGHKHAQFLLLVGYLLNQTGSLEVAEEHGQEQIEHNNVSKEDQGDEVAAGDHEVLTPPAVIEHFVPALTNQDLEHRYKGL